MVVRIVGTVRQEHLWIVSLCISRDDWNMNYPAVRRRYRYGLPAAHRTDSYGHP